MANIINAAIPFLLLPFLTRILTPEEYGIVAMFQVLLAFTLPFVGMNMEGAISRQYFEKDKIDFPQYLTNTLYILIGGTCIVLSLFFGLGDLIERMTSFPAKWLGIIAICALTQTISEIVLNLWLVQSKAMHYALFRITRTLLDIGLSVFFIIVLGKTWEGRIEGQTYAFVFFAVIAIGFLFKKKWLTKGFNFSYLKNALSFGVPLIPHVVGAIIITMSDRIFINKMVGLAEAGLYTVGFQVGMVIGLLQNSFNQAWVPMFYSKLKQNNKITNLKLVKFTYFYFALMIIAVFALSILSPLFFDVFLGKDFYAANQFVFWIALGFGFNGMYKMVVNYFFYIQKTYIVSIITFVTAGLNISLNYFLIKWNGAIGAAQATAISLFVQFIIIWYMSGRLYKMSWFYFLQGK